MGVEYPAYREADVVLSDGSTVHLRPVRRDDAPALLDLFGKLGPRSLNFRFFSGAPDLERAAAEMADVDYDGRYGLIAARGGQDCLVGHGTYLCEAPGRAEVAFAVADEMQGMGLGTILLAHLAEVADANGITVFTAEVLPENHAMVEVFRQSGFPVEIGSVPGAIQVELPTSFSPEATARFEERDRLAARAAVSRFLHPRAIAVVGASRRRGTVGGEVFHNLLQSEFEGVVYPVNAAADVVQAVRAYRSVADVPSEIDLAVVAVPAESVVDTARECAARGVPALVVLSAGFGEAGPAGAARELELVEVCRGAGIRLVGPNCLGVLTTRAGASFNATFAPGVPPAGNVGFVSQSGALGLALIDLAAERRLGVSSFASVGNRADITANDFLEFWESDEDTDVSLLYIESFSDPRRFSRLARRIGRRKPIVVVKSGRSVAGGRATQSHTGAMLSASDVTVDALFEQVGVIRTETLSELLDVSSLLSGQPLPSGGRVGIVTNAGGPGIMCADACEAEGGLEVPELPEAVRARLREFLPAEAGLGNPVDMIATATAEHYRRTIAVLAEWEGVDALVVIFIKPLLTRAEDVAATVGEAVADLPRPIPVQAVFMSADDRSAMATASVPIHTYPEDAAHALGRVMRHVHWRGQAEQDPPEFGDVRADEAAGLIARALERGGEWLGMEDVAGILDCYGVPMPRWQLARTPTAAGRAAREIGGRVALKAQGPRILHKSELGAVEVGLSGASQVSRAAAAMDDRLRAVGADPSAFLVQAMAEDGAPELLVGVVSDPMFGPVLACGAGGTQAELLGDMGVRICPLTRADAEAAIRSLATFPLLTGFRGRPKADVAALEELLLRVSAMVDAHHEIVELDLNPVMAGPSGALAVDARMRLEAATPPRPWPSTWR